MKSTNSRFKKAALSLAIAALASVSLTAQAMDTFDPLTNRLTLESVSVNGQVHKAVALTVNSYTVLSVGSGAPVADAFDPSTNVLTLGAVALNDAVYNNVQVHIDSYTLLNSGSTSNYTGDSLKAFDVLNNARNTCGFGLLAQDARLDAAAIAHANYTYGPGDGAHTETPTQPGFTGVNPVDRIKAKGYEVGNKTTSEVVTSARGDSVMQTLLSAPYHLNVILRGYRDVGVGFSAPRNLFVPLFVANLGYLPEAGQQTLERDEVRTYPCNGSENVNAGLTNETPNPVPGRDLFKDPLGTSVAVKVRVGNVLTITSTSMVNVATGAGVALRAPVGRDNDPNGFGSYFEKNEAYFAADKPLEPNTSYRVVFGGTNNGVSFNRTFTFKTGSWPNY